MDAWLSDAAAAIDAGDVSDADAEILLEIARIAAHDSGQRTNAPLLCYLVGRVQGERTLEELAEAIRRSSS
jgi:uncharacterized protein DUF6457